MGSLTLRASGPATPGTVWRRYVCLAAWPTWSPQIRAVHADGRCVVPGLTGTVEAVGGLRVAFRVEAVDPDARTWTWRVRLGPAALRLHHEVHARADGAGTSLTLRGPALVLAAYAPLARLALHRLCRAGGERAGQPSGSASV